MKYCCPPPTVNVLAAQQAYANLVALSQTYENQRNQNHFDASDAMMLPKMPPRRDVLAVPQHPGGFGVGQGTFLIFSVRF